MVCACIGCVLSKLQYKASIPSIALFCCCIWGLCGLEEGTLLFAGLQTVAYAPCSPGSPSGNGICMFSGAICSSAKLGQSHETASCSTEHSCVELWAQPTSKLHRWGYHVELGMFFPPCRVLFRAGMGLSSYSVLEKEEGWGACSWESGNGLNLHMLVKGLHVFTGQKPASS